MLAARHGSRKLQALSPADRANCISTLADLLVTRQSDILAANAKDMAEATKNNTSKPLLSRLSLNPSKLKALSTGTVFVSLQLDVRYLLSYYDFTKLRAVSKTKYR